MDPNEDKRYEIARKRVEEKKKFYSHLTSYLTMTIFFILLNMYTSPGRWWFIFPVLGWGIGIVSHYFRVFGLPGVGPESDWEDRVLQEELRKLGVKDSPAQKTPEENNPTASEEQLELKELEKKYDDRDLV